MPQPTQQLQSAIQSLHEAIAMEPEPEDKQTLAQCLNQMLRVQAKNMQEARQGGQGGQGPPQGGGFQGSPPAGPQTAADPRMALMAALGR